MYQNALFPNELLLGVLPLVNSLTIK